MRVRVRKIEGGEGEEEGEGGGLPSMRQREGGGSVARGKGSEMSFPGQHRSQPALRGTDTRERKRKRRREHRALNRSWISTSTPGTQRGSTHLLTNTQTEGTKSRLSTLFPATR